MREVLRRAAHFVIPHGHYRAAYPNDVTRAEARERLGIAPDARVVAFVGQVRAYKNVPELVVAARALPDADVVARSPATTRASACTSRRSPRRRCSSS